MHACIASFFLRAGKVLFEWTGCSGEDGALRGGIGTLQRRVDSLCSPGTPYYSGICFSGAATEVGIEPACLLS
jgi:hypothetical protein